MNKKITITTILEEFESKWKEFQEFKDDSDYTEGMFLGKFLIHALKLHEGAVMIEVDSTVPNNAYSAGWNIAVDEQRRKEKEFWEIK